MPSIVAPAQLANESCLVRVSDPGAFQYVDGGNVGSDPSSERRQTILERFQADRGHRDSVWLPISQPMYHAWRAVVGCPAATAQSMTAKQLVEALTAADALGDAETVRDVCMALRAPCHIALGLELPRALLHSDHACDQIPIHKPRRFSIGWLSQVLVHLPSDLATTLLRTALVPDLHLPPSQTTATPSAPSDPPVLWFPQQFSHLSPALLPLLVQALAPSISEHSALSLDLLLFPAAHDVISVVLPDFQHLKTLHLAFSHNVDTISDSFFERTISDVCMLPSLEALTLKRLGRRGICVCAIAESLPNARQLSSLALHDVPLKRSAGAELVGALKMLPALARLELRSCPTDDATLTRLRRTLRTMPSVRELALHHMRLPAKLAATLVADCARLPAMNMLTLEESLGAFFNGARGGAACAGSGGSEGGCEGHSGYSGDSGDGSSIAEDAALAERLATAIGNAATLRELRIVQSAPDEPAPPAPAAPPRSGGPATAAAAALMPLLLGDALARHLSRCVSLTQLHLSNAVRGSSLGELLSAVPQLRSLTVHGVPLSDTAAEGAALGLRQVRKLHHLDLSNCKVSPAGLQLLSAALRSASRMRVLRLCRSGSGAAAAAALAECLPKLPLLQELNIEGWAIGPHGMRALAPALSGMRALRVLNFAWNKVTGDGVRALVRHLIAPELLTSLNLKFNCIGNSSMDELVVALRRSRSLTHLDLGGNMFGADGMRTLCAVLVGGAHAGDPLPGRGGSCAAPPKQAMQISSRARTETRGAGPPQLRVLGLSGCAVGMEGVEALAAAVPKVHSLRVLDFPDLLLMYKQHRAALFRVMAAMRSANPQLKVQT